VLAPSTGNSAIDYLRGATYFVDMPDDYLHLLNCICLFDVNKRKECWNAGDVMVVGATKLTADSWSSVVDDVYNQPTKKRPYYYVHNQNDMYLDSNYDLTARNSELPTNLNVGTIPSGNHTDKLHDLSRAVWYKVLSAAEMASKVTGANKENVCTKAIQAAGDNINITAFITSIQTNTSITSAE
jgi:hypothetical protein